MARVALVPCNSYDEEKVFAAVQTGVNLMGGISAFVKPDEKILLKPNLLSKALPQRAITTHPAVFSAVARLLREEGYTHISYGDSPGSPTATPQKAAESCGIGEAAQKSGIALADFESGSIVTFPKGYRAKSFYLCHGVQEADAFINLPKMKTHALERITGAVKNLYGCICGINQAAGHAQYPDSTVFAEMLADLHRYVKPRLHIMDGIVAMEGNGPTSGTPKAMNLLLFSDDPVALDTVFAALVNLDPATVPTNTAGAAAGIGTCNPDDIGILTPAGVMTVAQAAEHFGQQDFDVFRGAMKKGLIVKLAPLLPGLQPRPKVDKRKCVACGICQEACPVAEKAVHSGHGHKAKYDYRKCIRCYCCQEMCPAKAISVYRSPLNRLMGGK